MSTHTEHSQQRIDQILNAATAVFARRGFHEARMDDIVAESGLSKGALYWYFKSKDAIITAILTNIFEREIADLQPIIFDQGSASERIMRFTRQSIQDIQGMMRLLPITYEFYALAFRNKKVRQTLRKYLRSYMEILLPVIQQGIQRGEFQPVDARETAIAIGAIIEGTTLLWVFDQKTVELENDIQTGVQFILDGLRVQV